MVLFSLDVKLRAKKKARDRMTSTLENSWFRKRTVAVLAAAIADNAQIDENRGVESGKLVEHDETRYL